MKKENMFLYYDLSRLSHILEEGKLVYTSLLIKGKFSFFQILGKNLMIQASAEDQC